MRNFFILALVMGQLFSASTENIMINKQAFTLVSDSYDLYGSKGSFVKFYRLEKDKNLTSVLRLTLYATTGSCASKRIEEGAYEIKGSIITIYRFWDRSGVAYFEPYGGKIQKFKVLSDGSLKELSSELYVEETRVKHDDNNGMKYLFHAPENKIEQTKLDAYVQEVERKYKGQFVFGDAGKVLIERVKQALKRKMQLRWKH